EVARMRDATEQELEAKAREVLDAANEESRRIISTATAEAKAKREEAGAAASMPPVAEPKPPSGAVKTAIPEVVETVRWHAESEPTAAAEVAQTNGTSANGTHANGTPKLGIEQGMPAPSELEIAVWETPKPKRRWGFFGRAR